MKIAVLGSGSWGTALARLLSSDSGNQVLLWSFEQDGAEAINRNHENAFYLPGIKLPPKLRATGDIAEALRGATVVINAIPSRFIRSVWQGAAEKIGRDAILVNASKGFEYDTRLRLSEVLTEVIGQGARERLVILSGPTFARETAQDLPTTAVVAGWNGDVMRKIQRLFRRDRFLTYLNSDVVGVEVGGAMKNVFAIGAGICDGLHFGHNTRAALMTRGLYEMAKLGKAMGADPLTFAGLTGMGDLILTCTGDLSRNRSLGLSLGRGETLAAIQQKSKTVAEGVPSAKVAYELAQQCGINNPVSAEIFKMLYEAKSPKESLQFLFSLDLKEEMGGLLS